MAEYSADLYQATEGLPSLDWCERVAEAARQAAATVAAEMSLSNQPERDNVPALWNRVAELVDEAAGWIRGFCEAAEGYGPGAAMTVIIDVSVPAWSDWEPEIVPEAGASSLAEYAAALRAIGDALPTQLFASAASAAEDAAGQISFLAGQTNVDDLREAIDRLRVTGDLLTEAAGLAATAAESIEAYCSDSDHLGVPEGAGAGASAVSAPPAPAPGGAPAPYRPGFLESLPARSKDADPTDGVLTTEYGRSIAELASGRRGPGAGGAGLRKPWKFMASAVDHVEGHAAAVMRAQGLRQATLYINNEPCLYKPFGCDQILPEILPAGATLTVHGPGGYRKMYVGNGEGLE